MPAYSLSLMQWQRDIERRVAMAQRQVRVEAAAVNPHAECEQLIKDYDAAIEWRDAECARAMRKLRKWRRIGVAAFAASGVLACVVGYLIWRSFSR